MILENIRLGFACNSSSTHSMIFKKPDEEINDDNDEDHFGWHFFTLASLQSKKEYIASILMQHFSRVIGNDNAFDIVEKWLEIDLRNNPLFTDVQWYASVDHQSFPELSLNWDGLGLDKVFFQEYRDFILQDNLVILGGNDNDPECHPLLERGCYNPFTLPLLYDKGPTKIVARKDPQGYWTMFDRMDGTKVRVFLDNQKHDPIVKSYAPELVDIKITNFCGARCGFCYQDSTADGKHGELSYINSLITSLSELKVFEVALGGGEPTEHPKFLDIIEYCEWMHIVPNFTTKSLKWLENDKIREAVIKCVGSFAYSVVSTQDLLNFISKIERHNLGKIHPSIQVILGLVDEKSLRSMLVICYLNNLSMTILGYKETGRGKDFKSKRRLYEFDWIKVVKEMRDFGYFVNVSIDTVVANQFESRLNKEGVSNLFYTTQEGKFSCYVDAVEQKIGSSSFSNDLVDLSLKVDEYGINSLINIYSLF